ncbi:MAG: WecB/TagA/CpsF family glycosyltransferase [Nostoc sp. ChiQUE01a]|nr:WecB/TagA/CpsF family glycosyltransferase [Nostoc sp. DedQUE11]MDZ8075903.1 WecB/TagA/CpsF family glycosyltransferase [Nostoc sp. DedQUE01]MDZ8078800.1 WecB/TagA/CpsF family glycosyltransferase [Nostoc sp. DcaGUA01]MDZ8239682.1 WecB/TagA/CpsF family glycosyltransferase [Nostoc sp. ChiQUE01a]
MNYSTRVNICDIQIDKYPFDRVVEAIAHQAISGSTPKYVVTPNAQHIVALQHDARFRLIYHQAFLVVPDGVPLLWAAKLFNTPLSGRVNGTDLFEHLCKISADKGLKVFLLGGRTGAAKKAKQVLEARHPNLDIVGTYCPYYGFESDPEELKRINLAIQAAAPDILFVGLGAPKQEYWIYNNYQKLGVPVSIGIGVSFELVAGMVKRAPKFMQKAGLEWLFRLIMEPKRLWQRYFIGNIIFILLVLKQKFKLLWSSYIPMPKKDVV